MSSNEFTEELRARLGWYIDGVRMAEEQARAKQFQAQQVTELCPEPYQQQVLALQAAETAAVHCDRMKIRLAEVIVGLIGEG